MQSKFFPTVTMKRIGIIGVGLLGSAVASRLLKGNFGVKGYDTRPKQVKALQTQGLIWRGALLKSRQMLTPFSRSYPRSRASRQPSSARAA